MTSGESFQEIMCLKIEDAYQETPLSKHVFLNFGKWKKNQKISVDFWKFTLKVSTFSINLITHHFCQFIKYNNFLSGHWFLAQNLTNFVFLPWKLDNQYYHSALTTEWTDSFLHSEDIKLHVGFVIGLLNDHLIFYFYFYFYFLSKDS